MVASFSDFSEYGASFSHKKRLIAMHQQKAFLWPRSRALEPGLIRFFFYPEQCFPLTNSSRIPPNHPNSSRIIGMPSADATIRTSATQPKKHHSMPFTPTGKL